MTYLFSNTSSIFQSNGSAITVVNPLPVTLGSANINIIGNITVPTVVNVASSPENPVHTHITEVGTSGNLLANNLPYLPIGGNVIAFQGNIPWIISNTNVAITNNVTVTGIASNVNINPITGSVNATILLGGNLVSNVNPFPVTGNINTTISGGNVTIVPDLSIGDFYGELYAIPITPVVQTDGRYGVNNYDHQTYTASGGNVTAANSSFSISCSSTVGSYGLLRSRRFNTYKPGQSFSARWFAKFDTPTTGTSQRLGIQNQESSYYFGLNGDTFGVLHTYRSRAPIYKVTVTSFSGTQTVSLVLNGVTYTTTIQSTDTINEAAHRISDINFGGLWLANQVDNTVSLLYAGVGPLGGSFTVSGSGTSSLSISQSQAGVAATNDWFYNGTDFNMPSWWHPDRYNQYQVKYSWAGVNFFVLNPNTGHYDLFYQLVWPGSSAATEVPVTNPAFKIAALSLNTGAATAVSVKVASMMLALEGVTNRNSYTGAYSVTKSSLTSNTVHHLLSIQNPYTFYSTINTIETLMSDLTATTQCNDPAEIYIYLDAPLLTGLHDFVSQDGYPVGISTVTGTIDPATNYPIISFVIGNTGSSVQYALESYRVVLPPGSTLTVAIKSTAVLQKAAAAIVWYND